ncbi:RloB domain-containing protein [Marinilabiliaceae bacterium ANBcel2]|nr:RloB domain-containing protein [Marinilabiliaceae bacterium ANBcel2]
MVSHSFEKKQELQVFHKTITFADISLEKAERVIDELLDGGCDHITFLTDYDTVVSQDKKNKFDQLVKKYSGYDEVLICDSMPSIEIWFLLHFIYTTQEFTCYNEIERVLKGQLPDYEKTKNYLMQERWFEVLIANGGFAKAIIHSKRLMKQYSEEDVGQYFPFTKMHLAIDEFEKQKNG